MFTSRFSNKYNKLLISLCTFCTVCTGGYRKSEKRFIDTGPLIAFEIQVMPLVYRFAIVPGQPILITLEGDDGEPGMAMIIRQDYVPETYESAVKKIDGIIKRSGILDLIPEKPETAFSDYLGDIPGIHIRFIYSRIGTWAGVYDLEKTPPEVQTLLDETMALARDYLRLPENELITADEALEYFDSGERQPDKINLVKTMVRLAVKGKTDSLTAILATLEDPDIADEKGRTALMAAAHAGESQTMKILIDYGAYIDAADIDGYTALMYACTSGQNECVQLLVENGAKVNQRDAGGATPIMIAAQNGYSDIVRLLLKNGGNPHIKEDHGLSAIDFAKRNGHKEIEQILRLYMLK